MRSVCGHFYALFLLFVSSCGQNYALFFDESDLSVLSSSVYNSGDPIVVSGECMPEGARILIQSADIVGGSVETVCVNGQYSQFIDPADPGTLSMGVRISLIGDLVDYIEKWQSITINSAPRIESHSDNDYENNAIPTLFGGPNSAVPGALVEVSTGAGPACTALATSTGAWSCTLSAPLGEGVQSVSAVQTISGQPTSQPTTVSIIIDTLAPSTPVVSSPVNGADVNSPLTIEGTCETGATVSVSDPSIPSSPVTGACVGGTYSIDVNFDPGSDGTSPVITVVQTDPAGNPSDPTTVTVDVDLSAPSSPTITSPVLGEAVNNPVTVTGSCETNATVFVSNENLIGGGASGPCTSGNYSIEVSFNVGADGSNETIYVSQQDPAGNSSDTVSVSVIVDLSAPSSPTITSPVAGADVNNPVTVTGSCETGATVSVSNAQLVGSPITGSCVGGNYSIDVSFDSGADGTSPVITVVQTDPAGNPSDPATVTVDVDLSAPSSPTITSPVANEDVNNPVTVTGSCELGSTLSINNALITNSPVEGPCMGGAYSIDVNFDLAADDTTQTISVTQKDSAGNESIPETVSVNVDLSTPTAPTITNPYSNESVGYIVNVSGACEADAIVSLSNALFSSSPVTGVCSAGGAYFIDVSFESGADASTQTITALQTDAAGNISDSATVDVVVDLSAPSAPTITSPVAGADVNNSVTVTGACETGANVSVENSMLVTSPVIETCTGGTYSISIEFSSGADGSAQSISVFQTDNVGNQSDTASVSVNVDLSAPSAPTIASPVAGADVNNPVTVTGSCETDATVSVSNVQLVSSPVTGSCVGGNYSLDVSFGAGADGTSQLISVNQTDSAGNVSDPVSVSVNVDLSAPSSPTITSPVAGADVSNPVTVTGSCETNATVSVSNAQLVSSPVTGSCVGGNYSIDVSFDAGADGTSQVISVLQTDAAGNESASVDVSVDVNFSSGGNPNEIKFIASDGVDLDNYGTSIDISGSNVLIGAPLEDDVAENAGAAYLYQYDSNLDSWKETKFVPSDGAVWDWYGSSVAISGNTVVVGSYRSNNGTPTDNGKVYVYKLNETSNTWVETWLEPSDPDANKWFGSSVAIDGNNIIVGAENDTNANGFRAGAVYLFQYDPSTNQWNQQKFISPNGAANEDFGSKVDISGNNFVVGSQEAAYLFQYDPVSNAWNSTEFTASDAASADDFGADVAIEGGTVVIGAPYDDDMGSSSGSVYVYTYDLSSGLWAETKLNSVDSNGSDRFGSTVAIDGNSVLVGAAAKEGDIGGSTVIHGAAYLFQYNQSTQAWVEEKILSSDIAQDDEFSFEIALSGSLALVSAYRDDDNGDSSGSVYLFDTMESLNSTPSGSWEETKVLASDGAPSSFFGDHVSSSGSSVLVGAPSDDNANGSGAGAAYLYQYSAPTDSWTETKFLAPDGYAGHQFGWSTAISGNVIVVGSQEDTNSNGTRAGAAYVYMYNDQSNTWHSQKLIASDGSAFDFFGYRVAVSGTTIAVGAYSSDTGGLNTSGAVYVYELDTSSFTFVETKITAENNGVADHEAGDQFGKSLDIDGNVLVVGAPFRDFGTFYVYEFDSANDEWNGVRISGDSSMDRLGYSVSVSGSIIAAGTPYTDDNGLTSSGSVHIYEYDTTSGSEGWKFKTKLLASNAALGDWLGTSLDLDGATLAVGAPGYDTPANNSGAVYIYKYDQSTDTWNEEQVFASDGASSHSMGRMVSISGDTVVSGARYDNSSQGSLYIYNYQY